MNNYYPLPTEHTYKSCNGHIKIEARLGFTNIVTNRISPGLFSALAKKRNQRDLWLHVYVLTRQRWTLAEIRKCEYGESTSFSRSSYPDFGHNTITIVPLLERRGESSLADLPEPATLKLDKVPIAPRSTYSFSLGEVTSSYQGEYPFAMSVIKGSMLSFDYLSGRTNDNEKSFLLLMNLKRSAESQALHNIRIINSRSQQQIGSFSALENHFSWHEIQKEDEQLVNAYVCSTCSFIPIYINCRCTSVSQEINVEHTHPPSELFWMGDDAKIASQLKAKWLQIK